LSRAGHSESRGNESVERRNQMFPERLRSSRLV
jgi:hypothetical protein